MSTNSRGLAARHGHTIETDLGISPDVFKGTNGDDSLNGTSGDDTIVGKAGNDTLLGGNGNDTISVTDLGGTDSIDGGKGTDTLSVKKAVTIDFSSTTVHLSGIEELDLSKKSDHVVLADGMDAGVKTLTISGGNGADTLDGSAVTDTSLNLLGGSGADVLSSGGKADYISGGVGADTIIVSHSTIHGDTIVGGGGHDTLLVTGGGSVDLSSALISTVELVQVSDDATNLQLDNSGMTVNAGGNASTVIMGGSGTDDITLGVAGQTVFSGYSDVVHATADTLFDGVSASVLLGSSSTLELSGGGTIDASLFTMTGFSGLVLDSSQYTVDLSSYGENMDVVMGTGNSTLITGEGYYSIHGGGLGNTVDMSSASYGSSFISVGNGVDNVTVDLFDNQTVLAGAGDDVVTGYFSGEAGGASGVFNGGSGNDVLELIGTGSENWLSMSANTTGFETIDLSHSYGSVELETNAQSFTVIGSDYGDYFDIGASNQTIDGGLGCDTVNIDAGLLTSSFAFDGGEGYDSINVYAPNSGPLAPVGEVALTTATLGAGVTNVEQVNIYAGESGTAVALHLTAQSGLYVDSEGWGNQVYAGSGSDITIYVDEGNNYIDLQSASHVSVSSYEGGNTVVLGTGTGFNIDFGGEGYNTVVINDPAQFASFGEGAHSTISGGEGAGDTLEFAGSGTYDLNNLVLNEMENVVVDAGVAVNLTLDNSGYDVVMGDQAATVVTGGEGNDTFHFGANGQTAVGGDGNDTYDVTASQLGAVTITEAAEGGNDTILISGGGAFSLGTGVANVETYQLADASTVTLDLTVVTNPSGYSLLGSEGNDTFVIHAGSGLETNSPQLFTGVTLDGGDQGEAGGDTIEITGGGVVDFSAAGVTVENVENVVLDAATTLTLNNDSFNVTGSAGVDVINGGNGNNTIDGGASVDSITGGTGNDTITVDVSSPDIVSAGAGTDMLVLTGAAASNVAVDLSSGSDQLTGLANNQSGFENVDASAVTGNGVTVTAGANTTYIGGSAQADVFIFGAGDATGVTALGNGGSDIARFTGDNDVTLASISGVATFQLDGVGTDLTVNAASLTGVTTITDFAASASQSLILASNVDLSGITVTGIETVNSGNYTLTINQAHMGGLTAITGGGSGTLTVAAGNLDLTSIALTGVSTVNLASGSVMTVQAADLAGVSTINGAGGSETLTVLNTADISGIQLNNLETLQYGAGGVTLTVNQANFGALSAISGGAGADALTVSTGNLDLTSIALTAVETINLASGSTLTANGADLTAVTAINGGAGSETLALLDNANLSGITFGALETIHYANVGINVTVDQSKLTGVTSITGNAGVGTDQLTMATGTGLDLSGTLAISGIEQLNLGGGGTSLTLTDQTDITGVTAIVGGTGSDTIVVNAGDLDLSAIAVTGVEAIHTLGTPGANVIVNSGDVASLTALTMDGTSDRLTLANADSALDLHNVTLTGVESIVLGSNADTTANTLTVTDQLDGSGDVQNVIGSLAVTDTVTMTDAGTQLDFDTINVSSIEHIVLGSGTDASANTLILNSASAASVTSITGGGASAVDEIVLNGGGSFNFSTMNVSNVQFVDTGDTALSGLVLNGAGYDVTVEATDGNNITSGAGSDVFHFSNVGSFAGDSETINSFVQGSGGDVLDLSGIGVTAYNGEFSNAAAASAGLTAHGAAYSLADHTLYVDLDGTAGYNAGTDLAIHLNGVTDLTQGTDVLVV